MNSYSNYHTCIVPECKSTSIKTPGKLWIQVPTNIKMRNTWITLARRDPKTLSTKTRLYFCEDHFDLQNDMDNYIEYKIMGSVKRIRMKPNCTPSRFDCQKVRKRRKSKKKPRKALVEDQRMSPLKEIVETMGNEDKPLPTSRKDAAMIQESDLKNTPENVEVFTNTIMDQSPMGEMEEVDVACFCCLSTNLPVIDVKKCQHNSFLKTYYEINAEVLYICVHCHHMLKKIEDFRQQVNESCNLLSKCYFLQSQQLENQIKKPSNLQTSQVLVLSYGVTPEPINVKTEADNIETIFVTEFQEDTTQLDIKSEPDSEIEDEAHSETQPHTLHTQNYTETHNSHTTPVSTIIKTENDIETQEKHTKHIPITENDTEMHEKLVTLTQNYTETQEKHTMKHKKHTVSSQSKINTKHKICDGKIRFLTLTDQELVEERHRLRNDEQFLKLQYKCDSCIKGFEHEDTLKDHIDRQTSS